MMLVLASSCVSRCHSELAGDAQHLVPFDRQFTRLNVRIRGRKPLRRRPIAQYAAVVRKRGEGLLTSCDYLFWALFDRGCLKRRWVVEDLSKAVVVLAGRLEGALGTAAASN